MQFFVITRGPDRIELGPGTRQSVRLPPGPGRFIARAPRRGPAVVHRRMKQLQRTPLPRRQRRPVTTYRIIHFIRQVAHLVQQPQQIPAVAQRPTPRPRHRHSFMQGTQHRRITAHQQIPSRRNTRPNRKIKLHPAAQFPPRQIDRRRSLIIQLDKLAMMMVRRRVRHDLVDDNLRPQPRGIDRIARRLHRGIPPRAFWNILPPRLNGDIRWPDGLQRGMPRHPLQLRHPEHSMTSIHQPQCHPAVLIRRELALPAGQPAAGHHPAQGHFVRKILARSQKQPVSRRRRTPSIFQLHPVNLPRFIKVRLAQTK